MKNKKGALVWIPLGVLLLAGIGYFACDLLMSISRYRPARGLFGNEIVGSRFFEQLFSAADFPRAIGNSLVQTLLTAVLGLPFGVVLALLLGLIPHRPTKAIFAGFFLMIGLLPDIFWAQMGQNAALGMDKIMQGVSGAGSGLRNNYLLIFTVAKVLPLTALCAFGGLFLNLAEKKNGALGALLVGLVPLLTALMPDVRMNYLAGSAINYASSTTLSYNAYRSGIMQGQYSYAAAMTVMGRGISLVVGLGPALLVGLLAKRKRDTQKVRVQGGSWVMEGLFGVIGAVAAMMIVLAANIIGKQIQWSADVTVALGNTLLGSLLAMMLAFGVCLGVLSTFRHSRGMLAPAALALIMLLLGGFSASGYILARDLGVFNTPIPAAFSVLGHPAFILVLVLLAVSRPCSMRQVMMSAGGGGLMAAMISAGDAFNPMLFTISHQQYTLAQHLRALQTNVDYQVMPSDAASALDAMQMREAAANGGMVVLLAVCLLLGVMGAMLIFSGIGGSRLEPLHPVWRPEAPVLARPYAPVQAQEPVQAYQPANSFAPVQAEEIYPEEEPYYPVQPLPVTEEESARDPEENEMK